MASLLAAGSWENASGNRGGGQLRGQRTPGCRTFPASKCPEGPVKEQVPERSRSTNRSKAARETRRLRPEVAAPCPLIQVIRIRSFIHSRCRSSPMLTDRSDDMSGTNNSPFDKDEIAESGLVPQLAMMSRGLWASPTRNTVALLAIALFIVIAAARQIAHISRHEPHEVARDSPNSPPFRRYIGRGWRPRCIGPGATAHPGNGGTRSPRKVMRRIPWYCQSFSIAHSWHGARLSLPNLGGILSDRVVAGECARGGDVQDGLARPRFAIGI